MRDPKGIGQRMRQVRESLGVTQQEVPARIGIGWRSYADYERAKTKPNGKVLLRLVALGFSADWILGGRGEMMAANRGGGDDELFSVPSADPLIQIGPAAASQARLIRIDGDAMEPDLCPGDLAVADMSETDIGDGGLMAIEMSGLDVIRRLQRISQTEIRVMPANPAYGEKIVRAKNLKVIGRVRFVVRQV